MQWFWEGGELSLLSTWRNNTAKWAEMHQMPWFVTAGFHCWGNSQTQKPSTPPGRAARAVPGQAEHTQELRLPSLPSFYKLYQWLGLFSIPQAWVQMCGHCCCLGTTCRIFSSFCQGWALYLPWAASFVTRHIPIHPIYNLPSQVSMENMSLQSDKYLYHVNWKGDTNIHQCLK